MLVACLSAGAGAWQDPKQFGLLSGFAGRHAIPPSWLDVVATAAVFLAFFLLQNSIDARYATSRQATAATLLLLMLFGGAWIAGFYFRLLALETSPPPTPAGGRLAIALITFGGSGMVMGALYNAVFIQKTDYTKLRSERKILLATITELEQKYRESYLSAADGERLKTACASALTSATDAVKIELPGYGKFIEGIYVEPLKILAAAAAEDGVQDAPESFLLGCGVLTEGPADAQLAGALRRLKNERQC
jgi:hypothetical protein